MAYFEDIPAVAHYVLEESWVLDVRQVGGLGSDSPGDVIEIRMDLVLAKTHPELLPARSGEWACARE